MRGLPIGSTALSTSSFLALRSRAREVACHLCIMASGLVVLAHPNDIFKTVDPYQYRQFMSTCCQDVPACSMQGLNIKKWTTKPENKISIDYRSLRSTSCLMKVTHLNTTLKWHMKSPQKLMHHDTSHSATARLRHCAFLSCKRLWKFTSNRESFCDTIWTALEMACGATNHSVWKGKDYKIGHHWHMNDIYNIIYIYNGIDICVYISVCVL